jgi:hypothetical protein
MGAPNVVDLAERSYTVESFESVTLEHPYSIIYMPPRSKFNNPHLGAGPIP